jgi:signal transduction histidine kinase
VQSHGGALGFDSTFGQGATFWFELRDNAVAESAGA